MLIILISGKYKYKIGKLIKKKKNLLNISNINLLCKFFKFKFFNKIKYIFKNKIFLTNISNVSIYNFKKI